jgi:hypothetical protein
MISAKQQFIAELEPLLIASEKAINADDAPEARRLALEVLELSKGYAHKLSDADFRDALNNPLANAIAERLGVKP